MSEDDENTDISTANTMRERAGEIRVKIWLLLGANRLQVTAMLAVAVFAVLVTDRHSPPQARAAPTPVG